MATVLDRDGIGGNAPPPIETHRLHIEELLSEAGDWLDGQPVENQAQADDVGKLLAMLREARKGADAQRAAEKRPHDEAAKAVQAAWKPLLDRIDLAERTAKNALAAFLTAEQARKDAEAAEARRKAEEITKRAEEARRAASDTDLAGQTVAEALTEEAEQARKAADRAAKERASATGGARAVSLRTVWTAEIVDRRAALNHYIKLDPAAFEAAIQSLADHEARYGPRHAPGINFIERKVAQ